RPPPGALLGAGRTGRDARPRAAGSHPAAARRCRRGRACGRPGAERSGGLRGLRPVERRARPPRPGRSCALRDGTAGTMSTMRLSTTTESERDAAVEAATLAVNQGQLVVIPTDTVYGIGADAFAPQAVAGLLAAK